MKVVYPDIGAVHYRLNDRSKKLSIRIKPDQGVVVSFPSFFSQLKAESFVMKNKDWIEKKLDEMEKRQEHLQLHPQSFWRSVHHTYSLQINNNGRFSVHSNGENVYFSVPGHVDLNHSNNRELISKTLEAFLRMEAKGYLPRRLHHLSNSVSIEYNRLRITKAKTRWGSCSSKNHINLSLYLMLLPPRLIDYVLLHELAHVQVKNHSSEYWTFLESICPSSRTLDAELKQVSRTIVIP